MNYPLKTNTNVQLKLLIIRILYIFILSITLNKSLAQTFNYIIEKKSVLDTNVIKFDSIPVSPIGFYVFNSKGKLLDSSLYSVDYLKSTIYLKIKCDSIALKYSYLSYKNILNYFHKSTQIILNNPEIIMNYSTPFVFNDNLLNQTDNELIKKGNISRGISIGNAQNTSVTSSLNLQLSGKFTDDFEIQAALTDNQVPFQPSGNTQQINEFDKVYIKIFNKTNQFTLGDYDIINRENTFMPFTKKAQGIQYMYKKSDNSIQIQTSNSVSKGKYHKMQFNGKEGIQGPYKLTGANNEPYIVILSATERIYIDGRLLTRGEENDYIIDYNSAELTFTSKVPITKDSRITAEFEYSDKNYARFLTYNKLTYNHDAYQFQLQLFHEFDARNQPLQQVLSDNEKQILVNAGNDEWKAVVPYYHIESIRNTNAIYYKLIDTLVNNVIYDSVFVYSTDSSAKYVVGFTYVGKGNGNYIQTASNANGRVYKWVAPINGIKQGDFEPIKKLIAPVKKTVMAMSYIYKISKKNNTNIELALSDFDKNTFSTIDNNTNKGLAIKSFVSQALHKSDSCKHQFWLNPYILFVTRHFQAPEQYKSVEFSRDWNYYPSSNTQEIMTGIENNYYFKKLLNIKTGFDVFNSENDFMGLKEYGQFKIESKTWKINHNISHLTTKQTRQNTLFIRYNGLTQKTIKKIKVGIHLEHEKNLWKDAENDSLLNNSFSFFKWSPFIGSSDTNNFWWAIQYQHRTDYNTLNHELTKMYKADEANIESHWNTNKYFLCNINLNYRKLKAITDTLLKPEDNLTSRSDFTLRLVKNSIVLTTAHQSNASLEPKQSYSYLEVPAGQGIYTWIDYNHNGIKELNEFEIAQFSDQATYIRINSPTLEYIKVYGSQLSQTILLKPELIWNNSKGFLKLLSKFSNQFTYQQSLKTSSKDLLYRLLPTNHNDSLQLYFIYSIRNIFSINKNNPQWGIDYIFQNSNNQQVLISGIDKQNNISHQLSFRLGFNNFFTLYIKPTQGIKRLESQFFSSKNYHISYKIGECILQYQPNTNFQFNTIAKLTKKINELSNENANLQNIGFELRKNIKNDNYLSIKVEIIKNRYNGALNNSLSYEMLEGLQPGWNQIYTILLQRNISSSLQLMISYQGRASRNNQMIHTGNIQMRAWF